MTTLLDTVIVQPKAPATHCVIWLHGLGADGHDFESIVPELDLPESLAVKFIFPHAPVQTVTLNFGMSMRSWFDIYGLEIDSTQDENGIRQSEQALHQLIQTEINNGIPASNIVIAGFSQGGAIGLHTALRYPEELAGIIGLSTLLPLADNVEQERSDANLATPIFLAHGELDPVVSFNLGSMSAERLHDLNYQIDWHQYPIEHSVCQAEIADISEFLQRVFK